MHEWAKSVYGDPCHQCGYSWAVDTTDAITMVADLPGCLPVPAGGGHRWRTPCGAGWSVSAYVCHVGDNLRIWAERLVGIAAGADRHVAGYDESALARARHYEVDPAPGRAVVTHLGGGGLARRGPAVGAGRGPLLLHPERGEQTLAEVVVSNAHDAFHHGWDIARTLEAVRCGDR